MVSHLSYVDDIIILYDPSVENLWIIRAISKRFDLASGFRDNFFY